MPQIQIARNGVRILSEFYAWRDLDAIPDDNLRAWIINRLAGYRPYEDYIDRRDRAITSHAIVHFRRGPCVYAIADDRGRYKFGWTSSLKHRYRELQVGNASQLRVMRQYMSLAPQALEHRIHIYLQGQHIHGEWFYLKTDQLRVIDGMAYQKLDNPPRISFNGYR